MTINKVCPFVQLAVGQSSVCPLVKQNFKSRNRHFKRNKSDKRLAGSQHTPLLTHTLTPSDICKCETDKIDYNNKCRRSSVSLDYKKSKIKTKYDTFSVHSGSSERKWGQKSVNSDRFYY